MPRFFGKQKSITFKNQPVQVPHPPRKVLMPPATCPKLILLRTLEFLKSFKLSSAGVIKLPILGRSNNMVILRDFPKIIVYEVWVGVIHHDLCRIGWFFLKAMSKSETYAAKRDILGGSSQLGYVVNNHSDRFCPLRIGLWDPFQIAELHGLYMGVESKPLTSTGMILQVANLKFVRTMSCRFSFLVKFLVSFFLGKACQKAWHFSSASRCTCQIQWHFDPELDDKIAQMMGNAYEPLNHCFKHGIRFDTLKRNREKNGFRVPALICHLAPLPPPTKSLAKPRSQGSSINFHGI